MKTAKKILSVVLAMVIGLGSFALITSAETSEHLTEIPEGYVGVYTKEDLNNVRNNLKGNYILMNDIVFDDSDFEESGNFYNDGMGWIPIGLDLSGWSPYYYIFTGVFDGNGYSISNVKMDRKPTSYSARPDRIVPLPNGKTTTFYAAHSFGLFAENAGTIKNLNVSVEYKIEANPSAVAGSVCGINSGLISNCNTYGTILAEKTLNSGDSCFGGIAGIIYKGKITLCANNVDISGKNPYDFPYINCGGIVGGSYGVGENVISYCYNNGDITPETVSDGYLAGIAARASGFGTYYDGYSFIIENCYNTGTIGSKNTRGKIAGICGEGYREETKLINCYNVGLVLSSSKTAGIIAGADRSTNCYYLDSSADYYCTALSTIKNNLHNSQMKTEEAFVGFDFNNVWIVDANSDYPYPQLKNNLQSDETPVRHNYSEIILVDSTCTKLGLKKLFCTDCGFSCEVIMNKSETHTYNSKITTPATHTSTGVKTYTCDCGDTYTETIAKLTEHNYNAVVTAPTCTKQGYTTYICICGDTYVDDYVNATGHTYTSKVTTPATHTSTGVMTYSCDCGDAYTETIAKLTEHEHKAVVTKPTCTDKGYTTYTCICGDTYKADYKGATGHDYDSGIVTTKPTCTKAGVRTFTCANCGDSYTEEINANGHSHTAKITTPATHTSTGVKTYSCACGDTYTETIAKLAEHNHVAVVTVPTCTKQGFTTYTCECGDSYVDDYVDANGHSHSAEITVPATHTSVGVMTYACSCGDVYTETIAKLTEHNHVAVVTAPTCTEQGYTTYTCECGDSYVDDYVDATGHSDTDNDGNCNDCVEHLCDHACHKSGFAGFFWKITRFFSKLFGTNKVCECGNAHY